jgi:hypothetical protein
MLKNRKTTIKEIVKSNIDRMGNLTVDELIELLRPHYIFDKNKLVELELRRKVYGIMGSFKDENGARIYYSDNAGNYIDVKNTRDLDDLGKVKKQLFGKYSGLLTALKKVRKYMQTIRKNSGKNKQRAYK